MNVLNLVMKKYCVSNVNRSFEKHDFEIETEIAGHATGFIATYDSGLDGPAIGF